MHKNQNTLPEDILLMKLKHLISLLLLALLANGSATAGVTDQDFVAQKTQNLINLCAASPQDPHYREAIHFCHGYLVGAYQYYLAQTADKQELKMFCVPDPKPSRNETIALFISWAQKHPEYMNDIPVETEFRFLTEKYPCKK
ncbi:Rap1a/Tai family immunity protein [Methylomicrobium lacus]|uniref:Rap1a/Tai family immunity protein n=1 Tax=Methylomicrobium lacus TaxID=136992 RepID=UPI0035A917A8